jgi:hypothetical protein
MDTKENRPLKAETIPGWPPAWLAPQQPPTPSKETASDAGAAPSSTTSSTGAEAGGGAAGEAAWAAAVKRGEDGRRASTVPPWDQAEADRLLAALKAKALELARRHFAGRYPPTLAGAVSAYTEAAERLVRTHEMEAARGVDVLDMIRGFEPLITEMVTRVARSPKEYGLGT